MQGGVGVASIIVSSSTSAAGGFDLYTSVSLGVGGIFVATALVYVFGYMDLLEATSIERAVKRGMRTMLISLATPLLLAFAGIVLYRSLVVIGAL